MKLFKPTKFCKICFRPVTPDELAYHFAKNACVCEDCLESLHPQISRIQIEQVRGIAIFHYEENFRQLLYRFKGCGDYELKDVFLLRFACVLHWIYHGYLLVPMPSHPLQEEKRGFAHVIKLFSSLHLPFWKGIYKKEAFKQSDLSRQEREKVEEKIGITNGEQIYGKKILLVDDVMTTGSTLKAAIHLLTPYRPKKIRILVLAKNCRKMTK